MKSNSLTKEFLVDEYDHFKKLAHQYFLQKKYEKALRVASFAIRTAFHYPVRYYFFDDELEHLLLDISSSFLKKRTDDGRFNNENKIVFYDSETIDSANLTEQFLRYFIKREYEILFIVPNKKKLHLGERILKLISENPTIELFVPESSTNVEKIVQIYDKIIDFSPSRAFIQYIPNDVIGFCVFGNLDKITRYYNDFVPHTFWIGKLCSDYFIEFITSGGVAAIERRKIEISKLRYLHLYPIDDKNEFQGFPFDRTNKIVGLSGGQLYKYLADPELRYFHVIKDLINENPDFIFCLAGGGMPTVIIDDFIKKYHLENRFILLGKRSDFYELVKNADVFFESFPIKGLLTPMFAVENKISLIGLSNQNSKSTALEKILAMDNFKQVETLERFYAEADKLIKSKEERERNVSLFKECKKTRYYFEKGLDEILAGIGNKDQLFLNDHLEYDDEKSLNEYLNVENADFKYYLEKFYFLWSCLSLKSNLQTLYRLILSVRPERMTKLLSYYYLHAVTIMKKKIKIKSTK